LSRWVEDAVETLDRMSCHILIIFLLLSQTPEGECNRLPYRAALTVRSTLGGREISHEKSRGCFRMMHRYTDSRSGHMVSSCDNNLS
jgi:hypothetical protein